MTSEQITLIVVRHGNTFSSGETPRRVGAGTDIPLVDSGREQAVRVGYYLKSNNLLPDEIFCSRLVRTRETAQIALEEAGLSIEPVAMEIFDEIDYGPDENKTEDDVIARIGEDAIREWNDKAKVPSGWNVNPDKIISDLEQFVSDAAERSSGKTIMIATSNGIARFIPELFDKNTYNDFIIKNKLKISTGSICILRVSEGEWHVDGWNIKP